jgi:hypothetical protein
MADMRGSPLDRLQDSQKTLVRLGLLGTIAQAVQVVLGECARDVVLRQISDRLILDTSLGLQ